MLILRHGRWQAAWRWWAWSRTRYDREPEQAPFFVSARRKFRLPSKI